ncbi:MAG: hypothetical protein AAF849_18940 [Bacteroidota bacterium]
MAYKDFKFSDIKRQFGVQQNTDTLFDSAMNIIAPSEHLLYTLESAKEFPLTTEKAISEALVFPILKEIKLNNRDSIELFSGEKLEADKSQGLTGECDFIFAKAPGSKELMAPIVSITEAKRGDINNPRSLSQAAAQLLGARIFNQKNDLFIDPMYSACTSGSEWVFLRLQNKMLTIDTNRYFISQLDSLLGVLQHIIDLNTQDRLKLDLITSN